MTKNKFVFFTDPLERKILRKALTKIVKYVHDNNIQLVVAGGSSAQPAVYLFKVTWKRLYGNEKKPHFYSLGELATGLSKGIWSMTPLGDRLDLIQKHRPKMVKEVQSGKTIFILEEFVETGKTLASLKKLFSWLGAKEIKTGCVGIGEYSKIKLDVIGKRGFFPRFYRSRRRSSFEGAYRIPQHERLKRMREELKIIGSKKTVWRGRGG